MDEGGTLMCHIIIRLKDEFVNVSIKALDRIYKQYLNFKMCMPKQGDSRKHEFYVLYYTANG